MNWRDEVTRIEEELKKAIDEAGGNPFGYDLAATAKVIAACALNSIEIRRVHEDGPYRIQYIKNPFTAEKKEVNND